MKYQTLHIYFIAIVMTIISFVSAGAKDKDGGFTVVIDPGHGGKDIGATDNGAREKDINLGVALELEKLLKKKLKGDKIVMTRDDDTYLTLQQRADVANKAKGDLFISIHTNSVDKKNKNRKTVAGSSVYALGLHKDDNNMQVARRENSVIELESNFEQKYSGFDPSKDESYIIFEMAQKKNLSRSLRFAEDVEKELVGIGRKNRGVHQAGFWVLWATSMPAVLVELDFICNPTSAKYMTSEKGRKALAEAICNAVLKYRASWSSSGNVSMASKEESMEESAGGKDEVRVVSEIIDDTVGKAAKLNTAQRKKKLDRPSTAVQNNQYTPARRRRRNETSRALSNNRSVETASIPLHTESERAVSLISLEEESPTTLLKEEDNPADKEEKTSKKKSKKDKEKKKKDKNKKKRKENAHNAKVEKFVTVYKIQILASADLLKQNNPRFNGLKPISAYKEGNLYKYYYGESTDKGEIEKMLKEVQQKIPDAFIVSAMKSVDAAKN